MGFLDDLLGKEDVTNSGNSPFSLKTRFRPLRLVAHKNESADLLLELQNVTNDQVLTSVVVRVKNGIGLDTTGISKSKEFRLGTIEPKEQKELCVEIYGNVTTEGGDYPIDIVAYAHYRDYSHVLNSIAKKVSLRVEE